MAGIDSNAKLVLHCDGSDASTTFTDSSSGAKTVTAVGNAQIDTAQSKFGGASGLFDGTGDYLTVPDSADWDFGTGDFTLDYWARFVSATGYSIPIGRTGNAAGGYMIEIASISSNIRFWYGGSLVTFAWTRSADTWYHHAVTRSGTSLRFFVDGTQIGSTETNSYDFTGTTDLWIGNDPFGGSLHNGWLDEVRISNGVARWTTTFTPPTEAYSAASSSIMSMMLMGIG